VSYITEKRVIEDLVILGRGAPDQIKDGRVTVCVAGYSPTLGFVRIYPTKVTSPLKMWTIVSVPVERNPQDTRPESWKIQGSKDEWDRLDDKIKVLGELPRAQRQQLVRQLVTTCVSDLDKAHVSLGIVKPTTIEPELSERADVSKEVQLTLFGTPLPKTKAHYELQPRLHYRCSECKLEKGHDQQIIEMGVYEWFRKSPGKEAQVFENLHINDPEWENHLLVGNQANHRSSYLVIGVIRWKKQLKSDTPDNQSRLF
jgi:hypothetical protein